MSAVDPRVTVDDASHVTVEYAISWPGGHVERVDDVEHARSILRGYRVGAQLVCRVVTAGPWGPSAVSV